MRIALLSLAIVAACFCPMWSSQVSAQLGPGSDNCLGCEPTHLPPRLQHHLTVCFDLGFDSSNNLYVFSGDEKAWLLTGMNYWSKIDQDEGGDLSFDEYPHDPSVPCPTGGEFDIRVMPMTLPGNQIGLGDAASNTIKIDTSLISNGYSDPNKFKYEGAHETGHLLNMHDVSHQDNPQCVNQTVMYDDAASVDFPDYSSSDDNIFCADKLVVGDMYNPQPTGGGSEYEPSQTMEDCYDVWDVTYHFTSWNGYLIVTGIEYLSLLGQDCGPPQF
jgi:hypothetical protein